ncbi:unnamed protein product [Caenorhabditis auriculariae]|uniref:Uncharacterized protein n=1 Tax=Caenorhabditis auriculariae TaxID=2777116 RepID=A0A8S1HV59_9PELO|nr:unnamed protein product [Caenorhabditis auriculariae]
MAQALTSQVSSGSLDATPDLPSTWPACHEKQRHQVCEDTHASAQIALFYIDLRNQRDSVPRTPAVTVSSPFSDKEVQPFRAVKMFKISLEKRTDGPMLRLRKERGRRRRKKLDRHLPLVGNVLFLAPGAEAYGGSWRQRHGGSESKGRCP